MELFDLVGNFCSIVGLIITIREYVKAKATKKEK